MKPTRSYHAYTSDHREPGGLRRLDVVVEALAEWRRDRLPGLIRVLVIGMGGGHLALPLASLGYSVVGLESDSARLQYARESAKDVGLVIRCVEGDVSMLGNETFDVVVCESAASPSESWSSLLESLTRHCSAKGLVICVAPSMARHQIASALPSAHLKLLEARTSTVLLRGRWYERIGIKRGSRTFHLLDRLDGGIAACLPRQCAAKELLVLRPYDPTRPLVMHVIPTFNAGGAERLVYELVAHLPEQSFETQAVAMMGGGPLEELFRERQLTYTVFPRRGPYGSFGFFDLVKLFRRERPDIVHTHLFGADLWGRLAAWCTGVRTMYSTQHNVEVELSGIKRLINRCLAGVTTSFVAVSSVVQKDMEDHGLPEKKIRVILNAIDLEKIVPRTGRAFADVPRLLAVGRLMLQKGYLVLFKALAQVKRPWTLEIVGIGAAETELRALADRLQIAPRIHWLGYRSDVPELLSRADVFCFPSYWEGLGLALIEAAATGVPIVASDLPVFHEILDSGPAYVPVGDVPAFAQAITAMLQDPYVAIQCAQKNMPLVRQRFSLEVMVTAYAELYRAATPSTVKTVTSSLTSTT